uniref:Uncharacterized protein n=1 Tax=Vitrella brassicaformis TaxID=1169539 RepID=A0A6U4B7P5_9ALVE|mmetsp:Transcript_19426/g.46931  ORF Transcript_19426/g.46931 Transcript_19426/m.46931 type:complete len:224 (+) Transcript_19426:822-1493(+)
MSSWSWRGSMSLSCCCLASMDSRTIRIDLSIAALLSSRCLSFFSFCTRTFSMPSDDTRAVRQVAFCVGGLVAFCADKHKRLKGHLCKAGSRLGSHLGFGPAAAAPFRLVSPSVDLPHQLHRQGMVGILLALAATLLVRHEGIQVHGGGLGGTCRRCGRCSRCRCAHAGWAAPVVVLAALASFSPSSLRFRYSSFLRLRISISCWSMSDDSAYKRSPQAAKQLR